MPDESEIASSGRLYAISAFTLPHDHYTVQRVPTSQHAGCGSGL